MLVQACRLVSEELGIGVLVLCIVVELVVRIWVLQLVLGIVLEVVRIVAEEEHIDEVQVCSCLVSCQEQLIQEPTNWQRGRKPAKSHLYYFN
jgi:hypothetical protein